MKLDESLRHLVFDEFPLDFALGWTCSLLRVVTIPRISSLLTQTGYFERAGLARIEYLGNSIRKVILKGFDDPENKLIFEQIKISHSKLKNTQQDYLFAVAALALEPIRIIAKFGSRPLTDSEEQSIISFWMQWGMAMGLKVELPRNIKDLRSFYDGFWADERKYSRSNYDVAVNLLSACAIRLPKHLRSPAIKIFCATLEPELISDLGLPKQNALFKLMVSLAMGIRKTFNSRSKLLLIGERQIVLGTRFSNL